MYRRIEDCVGPVYVMSKPYFSAEKGVWLAGCSIPTTHYQEIELGTANPEDPQAPPEARAFYEKVKSDARSARAEVLRRYGFELEWPPSPSQATGAS